MMSTSESDEYESVMSRLCGDNWAPSGVHVTTRDTDDVLRGILPISRTEKGRALFGDTPRAFENLISIIREPLVFHEFTGGLAMRVLRNLCARCEPNQLRAMKFKAHELVLDSISKGLDLSGDADGVGASPVYGDVIIMPFFGFAVEFLVNFVTGNSVNAEAVWKLTFPTIVERLFDCNNYMASTAAAALVHNCIAVVPHRMKDIMKIWENEEGSGKPFTDTLIRQLKKKVNKNYSESSFSWSLMIIRRLIGASMLNKCFDTLGPSLTEICSKSSVFSPSQLVLLQVIEASLGKSAESTLNSSAILEIPAGSILFFAELIETGFLKQDGDILYLAGSIIGSVIILIDDSDILEQLRVRSVKVAVNTLRALNAVERGAASSNAELPSFSTKDSSPSRGLKGVMMRVVAIGCDRCRVAQDSVRNLMGIPALLNALTYEEDTSNNPFLREWAVFAIRNITHGNAENTKEISQYELIGIQKDEDFLDRTGMEAFLDEEGKPKLRVRSVSPLPADSP